MSYKLTAFSIIFLVLSCGEESKNERPTKEDVIGGKVDTSVDWCEEMGWYHDGVCDTFCTRPDPDCGSEDAVVEPDTIEDPPDAQDSLPDIPDDSEEETPAADMSLEDVERLVSELVTAMYEHGTKYMGWAHYSNNCFIRMRAVYYYVNFGELPQYDETETEPQREMMGRIQSLDHSPVYEISFDFAGSIDISGTFDTDDPELEGYLASQFDAGWTNHHAALIYTDAGPRVVDIAFSHAPLTLDEWKTGFLPDDLIGTCAFNNAEALSEVSNYNIMKSLGQDPPLPDPRCVFMVKPIFKHEDGTPYDDTDLFPYMWNDVHEMDVSTDFVTSNCGDTFYLMTNPEKVPLIRLQTTSKTYSD